MIEVLGTILIFAVVMLFGVSALGNVFDSSENKRKKLDKHKVKHTDKDNT